MKTLFIFSFLLILQTQLTAQFREEQPKIKVVSQVKAGSVELRWAPNSLEGWKTGLENGYQIERVKIVRDGKLLEPVQKERLTPEPLKVWEMDHWENLVKLNPDALVPAQAIWGNKASFDLSGGLQKFIQKHQQENQLYGLSLMAADRSKEIAQAMGLYFKDENIAQNESYLYKIYLESKYPSDTGFVYVDASEITTMAPPGAPAISSNERFITLRWDNDPKTVIYNAFQVERSKDSLNFEKINHHPLIAVLQSEFSGFAWNDSVPELDQVYYYRLRGMNCFGDWSPPSPIVKAKSQLKLPLPVIKEVIDRPESVMIKWNFPPNPNLDSLIFEIGLSKQEAGPFQTSIAGDIIDSANVTRLQKPGFSFYFIIRIKDKKNRIATSAPWFLPVYDTVPPPVPSELKGSIDSVGIVEVLWEINLSEALSGFKIYRFNEIGEEPMLVSRELIQNNSFRDSIGLNTLSRKIYYQVQSVDLNLNHSSLSKVLEISKPDLLRPEPPYIRELRSEGKGVVIEWNDLNQKVSVMIYRRQAIAETNWLKIAEVNESVRRFYDTTAIAGNVYDYYLTTRASNGLESDPSLIRSIPINSINSEYIPVIQASAERRNRKILLSWNFPANVTGFRIYRKQDDNGFRLYYTNAENCDGQFVDMDLLPGTRYSYRVQLLFKGETSGLSTIKSVDY